ncbi:syntaxin-132-like isoform X1 [Andrographis paniculata]|uniref:syntaxin-132-like isoform X1 n=1 Tax=Andrographis paniculata TaxID=175694 RepID=UPI0021E8EE99|nr:syntaxin-132-like isoform X1 [Andrographis paniculata]
MNDLLTDSFVSDVKGKPHSNPTEEYNKFDIEMGPRNSDLGMELFNKQIQEAEKQVEKLSILLRKLKETNEESKSVTKASSMKAIRKRMEKDIDEVGKIAHGVKAKIEAINRDNLANRQKPGCGKGSAADRSRINLTNAFTKKFKDLMTEFQALRHTIDEEYREVVERRIITVTGSRPDEETINHLIETGNSEQIFQKAMLETGHGQVLNTLEEIQERHDAVREIEKKLLDLHQVPFNFQFNFQVLMPSSKPRLIFSMSRRQIYMDMAVLVEAQGDILDNIESQVKNAVDHVNMGADALQTAKNLQKKSRKCMMIGISLLLIIAVILVLSILKPWKK